MQQISTEQVCFIIAKARQWNAKEAEVQPDYGSNPSDEDERVALQDSPDDSAWEELRSALGDLNEGERIELFAMVLVGRGDFDLDEWPDAVTTARDTPDSRTVRHLIEMPHLGDYLEEALTAFGFSCS